MAIVSKNPEEGEEDGAAPQAADDPKPLRTNLPVKTAPVCGRRTEMQRVADVFQRAQREGRPGRADVVGRAGVGATTVALELARRAGARFPGGAWYVHLGMGVDLAWADLAATRGKTRIRDLAAAAREERERFAGEPRALLVLDGAATREELDAALPPSGPKSADVFVVSEAPLGGVDDDHVVAVSEVPPHAARRIAQAVVRVRDESPPPPPVRTLDGLALTAALAARAALAWQGKAGPLSFPDARSVVMRLVPFIAQYPAGLELMLLCSVAHPVRLPVDVLFAALTHIRKSRGVPPTPEEVGNGVLWLARAGIVQPDDEQRVSVHPLVQEVVRGMAESAADLDVAREALAQGLTEEALASIGDDGVDLLRAAPHQLRALAVSAPPSARERVQEVLRKLDAALGAA